uniref:Vps52 coiled-coil domain-containing protein n=1 Tax=Quercus lobata TaxID=97700 RepID=A0A7N2RA79_QUELO
MNQSSTSPANPEPRSRHEHKAFDPKPEPSTHEPLTSLATQSLRATNQSLTLLANPELKSRHKPRAFDPPIFDPDPLTSPETHEPIFLSLYEDIEPLEIYLHLPRLVEDKVVANILSEGTKLREYSEGVENNLRKVELDLIQDFIKESDNLVSLRDQIRECDRILLQMETLLGGFQLAESKLAKFVEDIIVPPRMVGIVIDGEVNDEYMRTLEILSKKLKFVEVDPMVKASKALKDVQPELEKVRQKAISKSFEVIAKAKDFLKAKVQVNTFQLNITYAFSPTSVDLIESESLEDNNDILCFVS